MLVIEQLQSFYNLIGSLFIAQDYRKGRRMFLTSKEDATNYRDNAHFFQRICEIGRRYGFYGDLTCILFLLFLFLFFVVSPPYITHFSHYIPSLHGPLPTPPPP